MTTTPQLPEGWTTDSESTDRYGTLLHAATRTVVGWHNDKGVTFDDAYHRVWLIAGAERMRRVANLQREWYSIQRTMPDPQRARQIFVQHNKMPHECVDTWLWEQLERAIAASQPPAQETGE